MELKKVYPVNGENKIYYYTNILANPQEVIDILERLEEDPSTHEVIMPWQVDNADRMLKDFRLNELYKLTEGNSKDLVQKVIDMMLNTINRVAKQYVKDAGLGIDLNVSPLLHVCKYNEGGNIGMHFDAQYNTAVLHTIVVYWNDNYTGGELAFDLGDEKISIKTEAGSAVCFPADEPFWHASTPIIDGIKYMSGSSIFIKGYDITNGDHVKKHLVDYEGRLKEMKNFMKE